MCALDIHTEERKNTFKKYERLSKRKDIKELFDKGSSFFLYPFSVKYVFLPSNEAPQLLIAIPKKKLKKSPHRNLMKRRVREVYRSNKHVFVENLHNREVSVHFAVIYAASELLDYNFIENKLSLVIDRLLKQDEIFKGE